MSGIPFPTRNYAVDKNGMPIKAGLPRRAVACHCDHPLVDVDTETCARCGHFEAATIDQTWQDRARQIAAGARRRRRGLKAAA